jgi:hypothetical protein
MNFTAKEATVTHSKRVGRLPAIVAIPFLAIAAVIAVASVVQAIRQDSWGPIWAIGWLPAVLVASLWAPAVDKPCWPRLRGLSRR